MNDTDHRKKMISLRLTEVELELLKKKYRTCGARNVSDLARLALQRMMNDSVPPADDFATKLTQLDERIQAIESQLCITPTLIVRGQK